MNKLILTLIALHLITSLSISQNNAEQFLIEATEGNDYHIPIDLKQGLIGVKGAIMPMGTQDLVDFISRNPNDAGSQILTSFISYLKEDLKMNFVAWTPEQRKGVIENFSSSCDLVKVFLDIGSFNQSFGAIGEIPMSATFSFCDKSTYVIKTELKVTGNTNYSRKVQRHFSKIYINEWEYDSTHRRKTTTLEIAYSKEKIDSLQNLETFEDVRGTYKIFNSNGNWTFSKILITENSKEGFDIVFLEGESLDWKKGQLKGQLEKTLSQGDFILTLLSSDKEKFTGAATYTDNAIEFMISSDSRAEFIKIK